MSILVVDDNTLLASKVARSLVRANHSVRTATSIARAREILAHDPPRALCLDLNLPDGNGFDLIEELRRQGTSLPVVITSGHDSRENRARTKGLGTAVFLAKPFVLAELHALLAGLLNETAPPQPAAGPRGGKPGRDGNPAAAPEALDAARFSRPQDSGASSCDHGKPGVPKTEHARIPAALAPAARAAVAFGRLVAIGIMAARHLSRASGTGATSRLIPIGGTG